MAKIYCKNNHDTSIVGRAKNGTCNSCNKRYKANWNKLNYEKTRTAIANWRKLHPERSRIASAKWAKRNPSFVRDYKAKRRALERNATVGLFSADMWNAIVEFYGSLCAYCGEQPWEHMDHVVPLSKGGVHALSNLVPACAKCNLKKYTNLWEPRARHPWMEVSMAESNQGVCKRCGYCPECGRSDPYLYYPTFPPSPQQPSWVITTSGTQMVSQGHMPDVITGGFPIEERSWTVKESETDGAK